MNALVILPDALRGDPTLTLPTWELYFRVHEVTRLAFVGCPVIRPRPKAWVCDAVSCRGPGNIAFAPGHHESIDESIR